MIEYLVSDPVPGANELPPPGPTDKKVTIDWNKPPVIPDVGQQKSDARYSCLWGPIPECLWLNICCVY